MKNRIINIVIIISFVSVMFSCVPAKQLENVKAEYNKCDENLKSIKKENEKLTSENNELSAEILRLQKENKILIRDNELRDSTYKILTLQYDKINELYEKLLENQEKLRLGADAEAQKALQMLQQTREELQLKENELRNLEKQLNLEKINLGEMKIQIELQEKQLIEKRARVKELEDKLLAQQEAMTALKQKISEALTGFEGNGLSVYEKNGNIYVSLDEKLLFKSGKWDVDAKGVEALKKLAQAIEKNPDINIMVEGHTDDLAYNANGNIQDNWDLSVKRATAIVKILLANSSINPANLIPAGRSCFVPIDEAKTSEARSKNRRTEIILTPKLNLIYNIISQE